MPVSYGGQGLIPPAAERPAAVAHAAATALLAVDSPLWQAAWQLTAALPGCSQPVGGPFWRDALGELTRQGFRLDVPERRVVSSSGAALTSPPKTVRNVAREAWAAAQRPGHRAVQRPEDLGAAPREDGLGAAAIGSDFQPVVGLCEDGYALLAALHAGGEDPAGSYPDGVCAACGVRDPPLRHWLVCARVAGRPGYIHDAAADGIRDSYRGAVGVDVRGPRNVGTRADPVFDDGAVTGSETLAYDVKSHKTHTASFVDGGLTLEAAHTLDEVMMKKHYSGAPVPVHVITFSCDLLLHERSVAPIVRLEALHAEAGLAEVRPGVRASMGAAIVVAQLRQWVVCAGGGAGVASAAGAAAAGVRRAGCWARLAGAAP